MHPDFPAQPDRTPVTFRSTKENASKLHCVRLLRAYSDGLSLKTACDIFDGLKNGTATLSVTPTYFERVAFESVGLSVASADRPLTAFNL